MLHIVNNSTHRISLELLQKDEHVRARLATVRYRRGEVGLVRRVVAVVVRVVQVLDDTQCCGQSREVASVVEVGRKGNGECSRLLLEVARDGEVDCVALNRQKQGQRHRRKEWSWHYLSDFEVLARSGRVPGELRRGESSEGEKGGGEGEHGVVR